MNYQVEVKKSFVRNILWFITITLSDLKFLDTSVYQISFVSTDYH